ncbi:MAG TPA: C1 family peptidase [Holophaga sp.]|nr:C1 family peptidase [Holophaga sp.]
MPHRLSIPNASLLLVAGLCGSLALNAQPAIYKDIVPTAREKQELLDREAFLTREKGLAPSTVGESADLKPMRTLSLDFSAMDRPASPQAFQAAWHLPPKRQWWTNTCWCFSTTSFLESELKRLHGRELKLSEMHTVYWNYVEKVREFVRTKGTSLVAEGGESGDVLRIWKAYGVVPETDYTGLKAGETAFNHELLIGELSAYLELVKRTQNWNADQIIATVRLILDKHLGAPPAKLTFEGRTYTPQTFRQEIVNLNPDDYVDVMSFHYAPFWAHAAYEVPDNWAHTTDYLNVPLNDWYSAFKRAIQKGYTVAIGGDVSEPGYNGAENIAIIPSFDIPSDRIDQSAREFRFTNHTSEDDHGLHVVGYISKGGQDWFLVKDSARSSQRGMFPGYYFYRGDYVKLKMLTFMVHKDAVKDLLAKAK